MRIKRPKKLKMQNFLRHLIFYFLRKKTNAETRKTGGPARGGRGRWFLVVGWITH